MNMIKFAVAASLACSAVAANAVVVSLNFEGIAAHPSSNDVRILDYYNGGTSSIGTSGSNVGAAFSSNALLICMNTLSVNCSNTSRGGLGDPTSQDGGLFFLSGSEAYLNYADGFTGNFSFNYAATTFIGTVTIFDGLDGTGNELGSLDLTPNAVGCPAYSADFCTFGNASIAFTGTARSIAFGGVANQIIFDDITFGSVAPGVPEPASWAMLIAGFGMVGATMRRRRRGVAAA